MKYFSIQEFSKLTKVSKSNLRYFESQGLITPMRGENMYRYYDREHLRDVKYLTAMRYADFSLPHMQVLMKLLREPTSQACGEHVKHTISIMQNQLSEKINHLVKIEHILNHHFGTLDGSGAENKDGIDDVAIDDIYAMICLEGKDETQ